MEAIVTVLGCFVAYMAYAIFKDPHRVAPI